MKRKYAANEGTWVCIPCRRTAKSRGACPECQLSYLRVYYRIRLPAKNNDKAWKLIEAGVLYWDKEAVERKADKKRRNLDNWRQERHEDSTS